MVRLFVVSLAVLAVASSCGGEATTAGDPKQQPTEASIDFMTRVELKDVLQMCRRHHVRPSELVTWFPFAEETITSAVVVQPGMSDAEITKEFRQSSLGTPGELEGGLLTAAQRANIEEVNRRLRSGRIYIRRLVAAGSADALRSLSDEASVRSVFLKPSKPFGQ